MQKRIFGKVSFCYIYILHCPIMMIPTLIISLRKNLLASNTIQPMPETAATISAATSVVYIKPRAVLKPVNSSGRQDGKIIWVNTCHCDAPRERAALTRSRGTLFTPDTIAMYSGANPANNNSAILEPSSIPSLISS